MQLKSLTVSNFRNFEGDEDVEKNDPHLIDFGSKITIIHGHNGAGKTNLLEAIYLVSTLRSFRGADLKTMMHSEKEHAYVKVIAHDEHINLERKFEIRIDKGERSSRRTALLDGKKIRSAADFYGKIQAILFTPEDLGILRGSPGGRRRFLDRVIFSSDRLHILDVQNYEKMLRSRNKVLKGEISLGTVQCNHLLDSYDEGLAEVGARIWGRRIRILSELKEPFSLIYSKINGQEVSTKLLYRTKAEPTLEEMVEDDARQSYLGEQFLRTRGQDKLRRVTSVGPHLDDLIIELKGENAGNYASQGQARALILAFKIAEMRRAKLQWGAPPLLLLDDVSSELDPHRNAQLFAALMEDVGQCVLSTTSPDYIKIPENIARKQIEVREGRIIRE